MRKNQILNIAMLIALIVCFTSGFVVKIMPNMWLGITHGISGIILFVSILYHCVTHGMFRK